MGFITILQAVIIIVMFVRRSSGTESGENRAQSNPEYEEVGPTPASTKNQGVTQDVSVQSAEFEEKMTQSNPEYEEVGLAPTPSKIQGVTKDATVQSDEYEAIGLAPTSSKKQGATGNVPVQSAETGCYRKCTSTEC